MDINNLLVPVICQSVLVHILCEVHIATSSILLSSTSLLIVTADFIEDLC